MFLPFANINVHNVVDLMWALVHKGSTNRIPSADANHLQSTADALDRSSPRLFALIIGINKYQSSQIPELEGSVPDAMAMQRYLEDTMGVPSSQITTLHDEEATRDRIIQEFYSLMFHSEIKEGDPILIYYAGHGSTAPTPTGWEAGGPEIQFLAPYDCLSNKDGTIINGIPDRTIGSLLEDLARAKGDNITVIFDCCHSGSLTRPILAHPRHHIRGFKMPIETPPDLDQDIWLEKRATTIASGFQRSGLRSHVLLAACGAEESAKEEEGRGNFTKALLDTLVAFGADEMTYVDLIQRIPCIPQQNPQCEGHNQDRICFDSKVPSRYRHVYPVRQEGPRYIMKAGISHGIAKDATFAIYRDKQSIVAGQSLGLLISSRPEAFSSVMTLPPGHPIISITDGAFALQVRAGEEQDLRIHVPMEQGLLGAFEAFAQVMKESELGRFKIMLVDKEKAELSLSLENGSVVFNILDPLVTMYGVTQIPFKVNPEAADIIHVLRHAAHYYWHLRRTSSDKNLINAVDVELTALREVDGEYYDDLSPMRVPGGPNLNVDGVVNIVVDKRTMYGIKLVNKTSRPLYPYLFFFDSGDLSITPYFQSPSSGGRVDAPLRPKGSLSIGYGAGGATPFRYYLRDGTGIEVGFLKLFVATDPIDMSKIPQFSPFDRKNRGIKQYEGKPNGYWHTNLITVVQRASQHV
ncbi:hypothetical protein CPB86DRAFT_814161 [Serendipita vermifera]|nr:hypothetical protein CPB86DRAFT_814161 [Serendipita vermifera]